MTRLFGDEELRAVTVEAVDRYFARLGWAKSDLPGGGRLFHDPASTFTYLFPDSEAYADYPLRVEDLLSARANWEGRSMYAVWRDLVGPTIANGRPTAAANSETAR